MSATDWALNAATQFVEQESIKSEEWDRARRRHQTVLSQAPRVWAEVRQALQVHIRAFNKSVGKQVLLALTNGDSKVVIHAQTEAGPRAMTVEFDARTPSVRCSARSEQGSVDFEGRYAIGLTSESNVAIALATGVECSSEELAGHLLNGLMGWN